MQSANVYKKYNISNMNIHKTAVQYKHKELSEEGMDENEH